MSTRQIAFLVAKIAFAAAALWLLCHKIDLPRLWEAVRHANLRYLVAAVGLCWLGVAIAGWRWRQLLSIFDIHASLFTLTCVAQIGQFFMMFLPSSAGDDLTRMLYISRLSRGAVGEACTSVVIDRCIGLASILLLAVFGIPGQWGLLASTRQTHWMAIGMILGGIFIILLALIYLLTAVGPIQSLLKAITRKLPGASMRAEVIRVVDVLWAGKRVVFSVVGAAIVTQLLLCAVYWLAGLAVGIQAPLSFWISFVPIVIAANAVPLTIAGIGVREYLLVLFLRVLGHVSSETALAASFMVLGITIIVCLLGGPVYIFYRPHTLATDGNE